MKTLKNKSVNIIVLLLGVILALTPFVIAPVCPPMANGMRMSCYYSGLLATGVGIGIIVTSLISIFVNNKIINVILSIINIIAGICVHLIPNKIIKISIGMGKDGNPRFMGYCMKDSMECIKHNTFTIVSVLGISIAIISLIYVVYVSIKKEK
ncbi:DUF4418 family protein [uncultured Parvimonas sp.]|uniref:DUF4418 family protein n=1 Tax=uncultured Parvimonas sp. TaxID=747372 RepID=UPI0028D5057A|nr:DUF4418 family protein [uncultured Parvimonas sp.]